MRSMRSVMIFAMMLAVPVASTTAQAPATQRGGPPQAAPGAGAPRGAGGPAMTLTTTAWPDGGQIPAKYTQAGDQTSPALVWANAPAGTVSFVLHMHDPDASINQTTDTQVHWLMWNIPATAKGLPEGVPQGAQLSDGSRQISATGPVYRGPGAPATGPMHHYTIEVYALNAMMDVQPSTSTTPGTAAVETRAALFKAMAGHVLGKAVYVGLFHRPQ
jgi:Raf kinase inhibitor-like YbhB/YbcL family protein